jgi:hypothetical protein
MTSPKNQKNEQQLPHQKTKKTSNNDPTKTHNTENQKDEQQ